MSNTIKGRNVYLDYVRALACILVILYHYTQRYCELFETNGRWFFKVSWGYMAVATFFMLSGYFASVKDDGKDSIWLYIKKKFCRLYPSYWIAILITFFTTYFFLPTRAVSFQEMIFNLTMLESFFGVRPVDGAYWTLANELIFYAFIAVVVVIIKKRDKLQVFCLLWAIILMLFQFVENDSLLMAGFGKLIAKQYGHMFIVGTSINQLFHGIRNKNMNIIAVINLFLSVIYQYIIFGMGYTFFFSVSVIILCLCVWAHKKNLILSKTVRKVLKPLEFVAGISYPLYLIHQNIGYAILYHLANYLGCYEILIIIPILVTVALATLIHFRVEMPAAKIGRM